MKPLVILFCLMGVTSILAAAPSAKSPFWGKREAERVRLEKLFEGIHDYTSLEKKMGKADSYIASEIASPRDIGTIIDTNEEHVIFCALRYSKLSTLLDVDVVVDSKDALVALVITKKDPNHVPEPMPLTRHGSS